MKLIRLTTTNPSGIFDNQVSDLTIQPYSKIALLNASFDTESKSVQVDASNNTVTMAVNGINNLKTVSFNDGIYNRENYQDFVNALNRSLNGSLSYDNVPDRGVEAKFHVGIDNKMRLGYRNSLLLIESDLEKRFQATTNMAIEYLPGNAIFKNSTNVSPPTNQCFAWSQHYLALGTGQATCRVRKADSGAGADEDDGFIFGVTFQDMKNFEGTTFNIDNFDMAIRVESDGRTYKLRIGNQETDTGVIINQNATATLETRDILSVRISGGDVQAVVHQYNPANVDNREDVILGIKQYNPVAYKLYPLLFIKGAGLVTEVDKLKHYFSPYDIVFDNKLNKTNADVDNDIVLGVNPPSRRGNYNLPQLVRWTGENGIQTTTLSSFFGFTKSEYTKPKSIAFEAVADQQFDFTNISDSYIIEMMNLELDSYDGEIGRRRSILGVIPESNDANEYGVINYEAHTPIFISINNKQQQILRNIIARITRNDNSGVVVRGLCSMTVLIKDADE